ncbi:hypothetical protein PI124_g21554 [Phytophthora idaei]|nr:hypothetical protein PI125_g23055 [Phytophthora idaei]KAG3128397.1 hypothetical protein PI126_g21420 [Phytophthora idaei]KAG3233371.1 hypothetical protein PI124_g21554 [Phytophthora idaei]
MVGWISLLSEYSFVAHYKPGKTNILADAPYDTAYSEMIKYLKAPSDSVCVVHTKPFSC